MSRGMADPVASSIFSQVLLTASPLLLYPLGVIIYNIYFHPLSKYPGSKSWAATYVPYIKNLLNYTLVSSLSDIHEQYGDVVRVGPNEVSFATEEAWRDIYDYRPGHKETIKDPTWYIAVDGAPQNIVTTRDPKVRARMRKFLGYSFTEAALKDQAPIIEGHTDLFISRLRDMDKGAGALADMTDWINFLAVDIIGDLAFGESFGCLESSGYHLWVQTLYSFIEGMVFAASARYYPWVSVIIEKFFLPKSVMDAQKRHVDFANEKINKRLDLQTSRPDFLTPFLKHDPDFERMSKGEIQSTFAMIIPAGSENQATVICGILNQLTKYTDKLAKLEKVIRERFQAEDDISIESTTDIPYLDAVISEGLRLCNPVCGGLPRTVPPGGDIYAGKYLPEGTKLTVRPYILRRSSKNFARATEFHPERWLPDRPEEFANDNFEVSKPFSTGPTGCLGKPLAWAEMRLFISRLVWAFDLSVDPDRALDWNKVRILMNVEKGPMWMRLKARRT
ncbi:Cytochrome P450 monooxygenase astJ [Cladobotryum mycophilum]|uniref:Cytochrome P450 monooxygenase astJ n=1 Tax=Cladobotryum mycophilum TaxID=491253 RepID=A0ABR0SIL8_9HYPO